MLIIYRINGMSKKRVSTDEHERIDMNKPYDIVGIQVCIPVIKLIKISVRN